MWSKQINPSINLFVSYSTNENNVLRMQKINAFRYISFFLLTIYRENKKN